MTGFVLIIVINMTGYFFDTTGNGQHLTECVLKLT